jgi:hypothetical protein
VAAIPLHNHRGTDYTSELRGLQGLYRVNGSQLGAFIRAENRAGGLKQESQQW